MIPPALGGGQGIQLLMGQVGIIALLLGFIVALAEFIFRRSRLPESNATLFEIFGLGLMLISTGLVLPEFTILMAGGFALLLVLFPASYCILFLTRKNERSLIRAIATFMFGSYLLLGFLYIYL